MQQAAVSCGRNPNDIHLLAVSKTKPVSDILQAYENGQRHFGENYVQEGLEKIQALSQFSDIVWHYIGPLQSNKSKIIAENFDWMHSLDRIKIAKRLNDQRPSELAPLNVCIQINIDDESSKSGIQASETKDFLEQMREFSRLSCRGLMTIPSATKDINQQRASFERMQSLFVKCQEDFKQIYPDFDTLSMGMSADMALAIEYSSTMLRVGTGVFGSRT